MEEDMADIEVLHAIKQEMQPNLIRRQPPQQRSGYDPNERRIQLEPGASAFTLAHERAHEAQHTHQTKLWRLHAAISPKIPYLHRLTRILVEIEATHMALKVLKSLGRCDQQARSEARRSIASYLLALFV